MAKYLVMLEGSYELPDDPGMLQDLYGTQVPSECAEVDMDSDAAAFLCDTLQALRIVRVVLATDESGQPAT